IEKCSECQIFRVKGRIFHLWNSSFCTIAESNIGGEHSDLLMRFSNNNIIFRNNITSVDLGSGNSNTFFENNFAREFVWPVNEANFWDNGSIGNYWSDYKGTDADNDGIGDTPYFIKGEPWDENLNRWVKIVNGQDNFPLMTPFIVPPSPSPLQKPQPEPEPLPTTLIITTSGASIAVIGIGLLVYFKKRNR
ncbi:MAG TPA: hypothetical protein VMW84_02300, partial [Acidobacteriota bacterium]|nr:hypothetical protein [Acidobacteriota bacterium]